MLACVFLLVLSGPAFSGDITGQSGFRIAVFTPTTADNTYWPEVHSILRAAATALDIELEIHEFDVSERFAAVSKGVQRLGTEPLPDAAVFSVAFGEAVRLMNAAENAGIPFFLNGPLFPEELAELGERPGRKYRQWVGYFLEDEELKGYLLAQRLIAAARDAGRADDAGTINVGGINGARAWYGSILREAGLRRAVDEHPDVRLLHMAYTRWTPEEGRTMAEHILRRYPGISVLWAASDQLAIGVAEAISDQALSQALPVYTGGLDLSDAGLESVLQGNLAATVAGTNLLWAQVIIDLHDYLHGSAPKDDGRSVLVAEPIVADDSTAEDLRAIIHGFTAIDFRQFSRAVHGADARRLSDVLGDR